MLKARNLKWARHLTEAELDERMKYKGWLGNAEILDSCVYQLEGATVYSFELLSTDRSGPHDREWTTYEHYAIR